ncbi:MAG: hypothetical protein PVF58_04490 [Candidatus Methanofastidiosia archaeon]|jgi:hypothetical protein
MAKKGKRGKKNQMGFTEKQLKFLLNYCKVTRKEPCITYQKFRKYYTTYSRRKSAADLIKKAYKREVITGPFLYANTGIEVEFFEDINDPMELLKEYENDDNTTLAYALHGDWNFIHFKRGASILQYADSIIPESISNGNIEDISFHEKGTLSSDVYPHGWLDEHWHVYNAMRTPRDITYFDAGNQIGLFWETVKKYYKEVLAQCKILNCFFPLGIKGYGHQLITFKTDYEIGVLKALKKLNRTTFIYKANGILILCLYLIPKPFNFNMSTDRFKELEENGYIRDVHICTPRKWIQNF